jgi:hypothetical protein
MKKKLAICVAVVVVLFLAGFYLWGPSTVPKGQEPLVTLSAANFGDFQKAFDAHPETSRLILLVSPT